LWIGHLALVLVEQLDHWLVGGLGRNREVGPETNSAFNLDVLVSIEIVTTSWNEASLYASWTGVSSGTG
jgi:hypothetical protein